MCRRIEDLDDSDEDTSDDDFGDLSDDDSDFDDFLGSTSQSNEAGMMIVKEVLSKKNTLNLRFKSNVVRPKKKQQTIPTRKQISNETKSCSIRHSLLFISVSPELRQNVVRMKRSRFKKPKEKPKLKPESAFLSQKRAVERMIDFAFYMVGIS